MDKYNQMKNEGKIPSPDVNPVAVRRDGNPVYEGRDGADKAICSFNTGCHTDDDYFLAPDGTFVVSVSLHLRQISLTLCSSPLTMGLPRPRPLSTTLCRSTTSPARRLTS